MNRLNSALKLRSVLTTLTKFNKNIFAYGTKLNFSFLKNTSYMSKPFSTETDDIHSDFKPKVKQEINNENVMNIIDDWVKNNDVVLFMKGTREMPRCGFSNYVLIIENILLYYIVFSLNSFIF
jgi:hypothetical protein